MRPAATRKLIAEEAEGQHRLQLTHLAGLSLHRAPPAPLKASARRPPPASARRHRFTDIRDTRKRLATWHGQSQRPPGYSNVQGCWCRLLVSSQPTEVHLQPPGTPACCVLKAQRQLAACHEPL